MLNIHETAKVSELSDIEISNRGSIYTIGENVFIDSFVKFKPAGGLGDINIKKGVVINTGAVLYSGKGLVIDEGAIIGANVVISPLSHKFLDRDIPIKDQGFEVDVAFPELDASIYIGKDAWIGPNSIILDGSFIPDGCVVSAGSVVFGILKPYGIYVGSPAKLIGFRETIDNF